MYLGIDVGTSSVKVVLIDSEQKIVGQHSEMLSVSNAQPMHSEQNPEDWFQALLKSLQCMKSNYGSELSLVKSIGLTGQMHGAVCIDCKGNVLRPAILWNDGRSYQECDDLMACNSDFETLGGNKVMPGFTAPKLLWIKRHEPDIFKKIDKVLLPKDYIRYRITGELSSDMSDASGTLWLDIKKREWSSSLLESCGLQEKHMPRLQEGTECSGFLSTELRNIIGSNQQVKVVAGASDNAAGALSMGVCHPNDAMISLGTSGVYFTPTTDCKPNPAKGLHTFCHAIEGTWHYMGVILSAASALSWWKGISNVSSEKDLIQLAEHCNSNYIPLFLPYLSGERTPHNDPFAKASFIGMTHGTTNAELTQSVLESIAFAIADCEQVILETGASMENVSVIGGGAKSPYWGKIISSVLGRPLLYHNESTVGPAFGAARLALYEDSNLALEQVFIRPEIENTINQNLTIQKKLEYRLELYRKTYRKLKEVFKAIGA